MSSLIEIDAFYFLLSSNYLFSCAFLCYFPFFFFFQVAIKKITNAFADTIDAKAYTERSEVVASF